jgi:hypothetical protein
MSKAKRHGRSAIVSEARMTVATCLTELRAWASQVLAEYPELRHEWGARGERVIPVCRRNARQKWLWS